MPTLSVCSPPIKQTFIIFHSGLVWGLFYYKLQHVGTVLHWVQGADLLNTVLKSEKPLIM